MMFTINTYDKKRQTVSDFKRRNMSEEKEKYTCRICHRELERIIEEPEDDSHIPLYYCAECNKHYRFVLVD